MCDEVQIAKLIKAAKAVEAEIRQEQARLRDFQAKAAELRCQADSRRKIIYGAAFLRVLERLRPAERAWLLSEAEKVILRKADRVFLGLDPETDPARILDTANAPPRRPEPGEDELPFAP